MNRVKNQAPLEIEMMPIADITPYANNPRDNTDAVDAVAASIKEFGWLNPIEIDHEGVIIRGHTRYAAAQKLGLTEVPVVYADDLTEEEATAWRLADNKTAELAEWDEEKKAAELEDLKAFEPTMAVFGFDDSEWGVQLILDTVDDIEHRRVREIEQDEDCATWEPSWDRPRLHRNELIQLTRQAGPNAVRSDDSYMHE